MPEPASLVVGFENSPLEGAVDRTVAFASLRSAPATAMAVGTFGRSESTLVGATLPAWADRSCGIRLDARDDDQASPLPLRSSDQAAERPATVLCSVHRRRPAAREPRFAAGFVSEPLRRCPGTTFIFDDARHLDRGPNPSARSRGCRSPLPSSRLSRRSSPPCPFFDTIASRRLSLCNDMRLAFDIQECEFPSPPTLRVASVSERRSCRR